LIYPNGHRDYGLTLEKVEVFRFLRASLTDEQILYNQGGIDGVNFTLAGGEASVPLTGIADYDLTAWSGSNRVSQESTTIRPITMTGGAKVLSMSIGQGDSSALATWDTYQYAVDGSIFPGGQGNAAEVVPNVPNNRLLFVDAWLSSPQGATPDNLLPVVRVGLQTDIWGESGSISPQILQGRFVYRQWRASNHTLEDVGVPVPAVLALETNARRYTAIMEPQVHNFDTISVRPTVEMFSYPYISRAQFPDVNTNDGFDEGQIDIHHVTVSSYELPADVETAPCN
jgi:hypothetical protein